MKKQWSDIFSLLSIILLFSVSCSAENRLKSLPAEKILINNQELNIEIAESESERMTGLMHRKSLDENSGMLFVFESDRKLSFWMKNTLIPLSIAFINSDGIIREIRDMQPESLDPVVSKNHVRYALEVNQGYFNRHNIKEGDLITLPGRLRK